MELFLNSVGRHHPAQKWAILSTLEQNVLMVLDLQNLLSKLKHLHLVFQQNSYSQREIQCILRSGGCKQLASREEPRSIVMLPYVTMSAKVGCLVGGLGFKPVFRFKIKHSLQGSKDYLGLCVLGVYRIPCSCKQKNLLLQNIARTIRLCLLNY